MKTYICPECGHKVYRFDGSSVGFWGIINAIRWLGFRDWVRCSRVNRRLIDERIVYEIETGN